MLNRRRNIGVSREEYHQGLLNIFSIMERPRRYSSNLQPVQEDDADVSADPSKRTASSSTSPNSSKGFSIRKKFGFLRRKKSRDRDGASSSDSLDEASSTSSRTLREGDDQEAPAGRALPRRQSSSLSSTEDTVPGVDKLGSTVEGVITLQDDAVKNPTNRYGPPIDDYLATRNLMKRFVRQGLPDPTMRQRAWAVMTGVDTIVIKREGEYDALVGKSRVDMKQIQECLIGGQHRTHWGAIERDLRRTLPNHHLFRDTKRREDEDFISIKEEAPIPGMELLGMSSTSRRNSNKVEGSGKKALRRILRAYSEYDAELGYCPGMNFIAANFLTIMSDEESFWAFAVVMNEDPYKLRDLFSREMKCTHEVLYIADNLIPQFLPKLYEHLEDEQIHVSTFVTEWL